MIGTVGRLIPSVEQWRAYRVVIQIWDQTVRACCATDLPATEFAELEQVILFAYAVDSQIMTVIKRFPKFFHIGIIPD
eukprot:3587673-Lingulodinium_polyedra.AAC.1